MLNILKIIEQRKLKLLGFAKECGREKKTKKNVKVDKIFSLWIGSNVSM